MNILKALLRRSWLALLCTVLIAAAVFPLESWAEESPAVPVESAELKTDTDDTVATTGPVSGSMEIISMDKYEEIYLSGAGYRIFDSDGNQVAEGYTNGFGRLYFADIPRGSYTYQEFKAPQGFEPDEREHSFEIREDNLAVSHTRLSVRRPGTIKVKKKDPDGNSVEGVAFLLEFSIDQGSTWLPVFIRDETDTNIVRGGCTSPGLIDGQLVTDEFGMAQFTGLRADSRILYRLTETAAPEGYSPMEGSHYVGTLPIRTENIYASDAEVFGTYAFAYTLRVTATDDPVFRLPEAGASGFGYLPLAMLLFAAPIPIIIKTKQRKGDNPV